ncbi:MAG: hypothetical protein GY711_34825 [bacterium]|nr:hypothetical protein [bacterium]
MIAHALPALALATCTATSAVDDTPADKTPVELGRVGWTRNLDEAAQASAKDGRPVLLLFQEIPG